MPKINRTEAAVEIARTMQRAHKASKTLFGEGWPHEVAQWKELIQAHQQLHEVTEMEAVVGIALSLEGAPYNLMAFLGAAFEIITPKTDNP